jgi:hypothetical protein
MNNKTEVEEQYEGNFKYLLFSMVFLLLATSSLSQFEERLAHLIWELMIMATLVIGVWSLSHDRKWFVSGIALSLTIVLLVIIAEATKIHWLVYLIVLCWYLFFLMAFVFTAKAVIRTREIDANSIVGAICIFMMAAFMWSMTYSVILMFDPAAFKGVDIGLSVTDSFSQMTYFSFVTITTLGYGDISPVLPIAQSIVVLEAMFGQFFIAIFVAGMVAIHISNRMAARQSG